MPNDDTGQVPGNYNHWIITAPSRCVGKVCGICVERAPENFSWQTPYEDRAQIHQQPITQLEDNNILSAATDCPPQIISTAAPE